MGTVERIFELVDQKYTEQRFFAGDIGVTPSIVSQWRKRKSASYSKHLPKIAEVLETTTEYLLTGKEPDAPPAGEFSEEELHILRQIHDRPGMRVMFSLTSKATDEDVRKATEIIRAFLGTPEGET